MNDIYIRTRKLISIGRADIFCIVSLIAGANTRDRKLKLLEINKETKLIAL